MKPDPEIWSEKIRSADKYHQEWENLFKVKALEKYAEGFHYAQTDVNAYIINLFFSTIEVKMPGLLFQTPICRVKPTPVLVKQDTNYAFEYALNNEDMLNYWAINHKTNFFEEIYAAIDDSWARFGIIELGYSADWIDNPNVGKPAHKADYDLTAQREGKKNVLRYTPEIPVNEQIYIRNIPAERFRVSAIDNAELEHCDWCGYFEYVRIEDLKSAPGLFNLDKIESADYRSAEFFMTSSAIRENERERIEASGDYLGIWKIWDIRMKRRYIFLHSRSLLLYNRPYEEFPFVDLRFRRRKRIKGFYPLPLTFNWISPQDELNEVRESNRIHRRRFKRVLVANRAAFEDNEEVAKLINGPDGTIIWANRDGAINPIPYADLGSAASVSMQMSKDDFNIVSGTSSEARGESDRTTATQASITNTKAQVRETRERLIVAFFLQRVFTKAMKIMRTKLVNNVTVGRPVTQGFLQNYTEERESVEINPVVDLGPAEAEFDVTIEIDSMSPVANEAEKAKFLEFLSLLSNFPQFSMSPTLIAELAFRVGYRNTGIIKEFQQMAQLAMIGQIEQGQQALNSSSNFAQTQVQQQTPPDLEQIRGQLLNQGIGI